MSLCLEDLIEEIKLSLPKTTAVEVDEALFDEYIERVLTCPSPLYIHDVLVIVNPTLVDRVKIISTPSYLPEDVK